jgi:hypothetical protein
MKFFNQGFAAVLAALSLTGAAHADFVTVGTPSENRIQVDTRWTRDNVYILSRVIFVDNGATLTIEPGTIVRGITSNMSGYSSEPGTLVVARGGKLVANGTADDPIIFTSIDDPNVPGGLNTVPDVFSPGGSLNVISGEFRRATFTASTDVFNISSGFLPANNDTVVLSSAPSGFTNGTTYHVVNATGTTFQLAATSGGPAILASSNDTQVHITLINGVTPTDDAANDHLLSAIPMVNNTTFIFDGSTSIPAPFAAATTYHVVQASATAFGGWYTFKLSATSGGSAIDITSAGSGIVLSPPGAYVIKGGSRSPLVTFNDYSADGLEGDNGFAKSASWGGVIICGRAFVAQSTGTPAADSFSGGTFPQTTGSPDGIWDAHVIIEPTGQNNGTGADYVEGLSTSSGSTVLNDTLAIYGGTNDADNSGVMRFCSLRYCGFVVGAAATGNEINGLTICGAGTGSVYEHIEIFQSRDDGFEWFGGKHDTRFLASISNQDDSFDGDEGFRGTHQFWLAAQGTISQSSSLADPMRRGFTNNDYVGQEETASDYRYDRLLEWDGGEGDNGDRLPISDITILNSTFLSGNTQKRGFNPKLEAHVAVHNSVVEGASTVAQQDTTTTGLVQTLLSISNIHSNYDLSASSSKGTTSSHFAETTPVFVEETASQIASAWNTNAELTAGDLTTTFNTSDLYTKNGFDPRTSGASALSADGTFATPSGFVDLDSAGAMISNNWLSGWSTLEWLEVLPTTNVARPVMTIGHNGTNPTISFPTAGSTVQYVIEKSTDGKNWTVLTTTPLSHATTVSHTDTTTPLATTVLYRAYAL